MEKKGVFSRNEGREMSASTFYRTAVSRVFKNMDIVVGIAFVLMVGIIIPITPVFWMFCWL